MRTLVALDTTGFAFQAADGLANANSREEFRYSGGTVGWRHVMYISMSFRYLCCCCVSMIYMLAPGCISHSETALFQRSPISSPSLNEDAG